MIYKDFKGLRISALAFGAMRLPVDGNDDAKPNQAKTDELVDAAMKAGINYYDTAWGYHGGNSEIVMGKALARYPRERYFLADKFPGYDVANMPKVKEIFPKQLEKTGAGYFDFYLIHNVCETNIEYYLDPKYGIVPYLLKMKEEGKIRHLGFSCHSNYDNMVRFLDAYGEHMEFCQLQINWVDWEFQSGKRKVEKLKSMGIPVWVMEPLRGGKLAKLPEKYMNELEAVRPGETAVGWSFRFLQSQPDLVVTLTGMSDMQQMKDKIALYQEEDPLTGKQMETLLKVASEMTSEGSVPCTACHYCTSHCPKHLDIPWLIELYNETKFTGGGFIGPMAYGALAKDKRASACIACRSCEKVCPQQIKISDVMKATVKMLGE